MKSIICFILFAKNIIQRYIKSLNSKHHVFRPCVKHTSEKNWIKIAKDIGNGFKENNLKKQNGLIL